MLIFKNTGAQEIKASLTGIDGAPYEGPGPILCYVWPKGGGEALGGTSAGVCTAGGNGAGSCKYVPTQAETNNDGVSFTFMAPGALPLTINCATWTGDPFALLNTAMPDSVAANDAIPTVIQAIYELFYLFTEKDVVGLTVTSRKANGLTALKTYTINQNPGPTTITRN